MFSMKLEITIEIEQLLLELKASQFSSRNEAFQFSLNLLNTEETFQLRLVLSNLNGNFPTVLFNYTYPLLNDTQHVENAPKQLTSSLRMGEIKVDNKDPALIAA